MAKTAEKTTTTINVRHVPYEAWKRLKLKAAQQDRTAQDIIISLIEGYANADE